MSKLYVGQRVRIVRSAYSNMVGKEAKIWKADYHPSHVQHGAGFYFYLDVVGIGRANGNGRDIAYRGVDLEPILDQHQPCESEFKESLDKLLEGLPA